MIASRQQPPSTDTTVRRAGSVLAFLLGLLLISPLATAEQPPELLHVRDSQASVVPGAGLDDIPGTSTTPKKKTIVLQEALKSNSPPVPTADDGHQSVRPSMVLLEERNPAGPRQDLGWGLAGTGASIFTGALLFHLQSSPLRAAAKDLPAKDARQQHPVQQDLERTQKIVVGLYALSGSMITSGVVLMAHERRDLKSVRARLAPAWMKGNPAARLEISF
jgi:hypothetical protein